MLLKKEVRVLVILLLLLSLIEVKVAYCGPPGYQGGGEGATNPWGEQSFSEQDFDKDKYTGTPDADVQKYGVTFLANSQISVTGGKITADKVEMPDGSVVSVTDATIKDGKITGGSFTVLSGSYQGVQDATISSTEVNMNSLTYATITPTSSSGTTTLVNAKGVRSTRTSLSVVHADSISVGDSTFTNVTNFTTNFVNCVQ
jgi:hypothetical protein